MTRRTKILILAGAALLIGLFLLRIRGALTPFYLAIAIAYLGYPFVTLLESKQVPRSLAILLLYGIFAVVVIFVFYAFLPSLNREIEQLVERLPEQTRRLESLSSSIFRNMRREWLPGSLQEVINLAIRRLEGLLEGAATRVADLVVGFLSQMVNLILAPFLAYYILKDRDQLGKAAVAWLPTGARKDVIELAHRVNKVVGRFIRGQLIVSTTVGILVACGLSLLGMRYALFLGLIAGVFDIIPYFGPILGAIPAVVLALMRSPLTALWVLLLFVVIQQLEGNVLSPKIVGEQVGLHPLAVIFSILVGGELLGVPGMLIAVPTAATVKVTASFIGEKLLEEGS